jgi:hypothetical protein
MGYISGIQDTGAAVRLQTAGSVLHRPDGRDAIHGECCSLARS